MRTYYIAIVVLIVLIAFGIAYRVSMVPQSPELKTTAAAKAISITIPLHTWSFEPDHIDAHVGDILDITVKNDDDIEHGFAIDEYHISQHIPPGTTATIPRFVVDKEGTFQFFCSVVCGQGMVENGSHKGMERGHFDMGGTLTVGNPPVSSTSTAL